MTKINIFPEDVLFASKGRAFAILFVINLNEASKKQLTASKTV
jgi:hypothetical protein